MSSRKELIIYLVTLISRPRLSGKGGGVGVCITDGIRWDRRFDLESEKIESVWLEIRPRRSKNFLLGYMYRPPESSKYLGKDFVNHLNGMLSKLS